MTFCQYNSKVFSKGKLPILMQSYPYRSIIMIFLDPRNDIAFKKIFGSDEHKNITISFLNSILELKGPKAIVSIDFLNNEQLPQIIGKKDNIFDVFCIDQSNNKYIVELQVNRVKEFGKRMIYYGAKTYSLQLDRGKPYHELTPVIVLSVVDFVMFPNKKRYKSIHRILDDISYENDLRELAFAFVELPKFTKKENELQSNEDKWIFFIKNIKKHTEIPAALGQNEFEEACHVAQRMTWSEQELNIYDAAFINATDYQTGMELAQEESLAKGIEKGISRGKIAVAHELLACGINIEIIAKSTGLFIDEINQLKQK